MVAESQQQNRSLRFKYKRRRRFAMAVDLTPRFRRLNSQTRSFRVNIQHDFSRPFGATQLWHNIIKALQTQVEVRPYRRHLCVHADCFTGSDAVDAVLSYLMQNAVFCTSAVSRLKAARLCQALMEARVFEPVGTKLFRRDKEVSFEDNGGSLYRFLEHEGVNGLAMKVDNSDTENTPADNFGTKRKKSSRVNEMRTIANPLAVGSSDRRVERLLRAINLQTPLFPALNTTPSASSFLSKAVVNEVWKQQTLLQLLQIIELPVLDCILTSPERVQPRSCRAPLANLDLVISNTCLERELPESLNLLQLDAWLSAAADCLELFPDQLIMIAGEQLSQQNGDLNAEQIDIQKRLLFDTIGKYYSGREKTPLIPGRYLDVHVAVLNLLDEGKTQDAFRAAQLCLRLLETSGRDELRRLLAFMASAARSDACRLQKQTDNRTSVCRTFQRALVQNRELTRSQSETLVLFLMDNYTELFKTPTALVEAVRRTLRTLQQGKDPDFVASFTFCQQATPQEYEDQRDAATSEGLRQLLCEISSNRSMPAKQRRKLLKEFEKHHPVVFLQHISNTF